MGNVGIDGSNGVLLPITYHNPFWVHDFGQVNLFGDQNCGGHLGKGIWFPLVALSLT